MKLRRVLILSAGLLAVVLVTCNSIFAKRSQETADDGYEYVTPLGSNMVQRVKKGTAPVTTSRVEVSGGDSVKDAIMKNSNQPKALH